MAIPSSSVLSPPIDVAPGLDSGHLARALRDEQAVLDDLVATLERQRSAVAIDDIEAVNDSVFAAHRLLGAYREARSRRRSVVIFLCEGGEGSVDDLPRVLGTRLTDSERTASEMLRAAARRLVGTVEQNRRMLQAAMTSGDAFFRVLTGTGATPEGYAPPSRAAAPHVGHRLVDLRG